MFRQPVPIVGERRGFGFNPNEVWLEEFVEEEPEQRPTPARWKQVTQKVTRQASGKIDDAWSTARDQFNEAKRELLDWIWKGGERRGPLEMPPCPPYYLLCDCTEPTRIRPIDDAVCECGSPGFRCENCCGLLPVCPYCGRRLPCQQACALGKTPRPSAPSPLPELHVTSVGPFRDKRYVEDSRRPCPKCATGFNVSNLLENLAANCGRYIGVHLPGCQREPPPMPVPGRPIQVLVPFFFPPAPPARRRGFPFSLFQKPEPVFKPPNGGLFGAVEDLVHIGVGTTGLAVDSVADVLDAAIGSTHGGGEQKCNCEAPLLRYPKNGIYEDPPVPPTRATGCRMLDAFNNFMDALAFQPSQRNDVELIAEAEIPETEKTGIPFIDQINDFLDHAIPHDRTVITPSAPQPHDPVQALVTYLTANPKEAPETDMLTCLQPDKSGLNFIERHLPATCLGQNLEFGTAEGEGKQIDYVNFTLLPSDVTESKTVGRAGPAGRPLVPVSST